MVSVVAYGENVTSAGGLRATDVQATIEKLEDGLRRAGSSWRDVDLLWLSNSVALSGDSDEELTRLQEESETAIITTLTDFAEARGWFPSLIGSTVKASFFSSAGNAEADVSSGLLWVALTGSVTSPVPVGVDVSETEGARAQAGRNALAAALAAASAAAPDSRTVSSDALARSALGLVLTSGSGHVEGTTDIDFKECYAVGQVLKYEADRQGVMLSGGCASNRGPGQSQTLYFSQVDDAGTTYQYTLRHAAVVAVLPSTQGLLHLEHPYQKISDERLNLEFHDHEKYAAGRYFCVRAINGVPPSDYLRANGWDITDTELAAMVENHTAIPTEPKAHKVSIASAPPDQEASLWPNVPVWFEEVGDEVLLRLVRAEAQDSDFFLVGMDLEDLVVNAGELATAFIQNRDASSNLIAFLCESRKYVLEDAGRNDEAKSLLSAADADTTVVGIYLNGEYSTGDFRSIGYHNYSQIGVLVVDEVD